MLKTAVYARRRDTHVGIGGLNRVHNALSRLWGQSIAKNFANYIDI